MVDLFKALGDENRLRIMHILMNETFCVCEIETLLDLSQSNVSRHLNKLKSVELIKSEKDAQWIHYTVNNIGDSLLSYLKSNFDKEPYLSDKKRLDNYKSNHLSCSEIRQDKEMVLEMIRLVV